MRSPVWCTLDRLNSTRRALALTALAVLLVADAPTRVRTQASESDGVSVLLGDLRRIVLTSDIHAFLAMNAGDVNRAREFAEFQLASGATRVVLQERDRAVLAASPRGSAIRLIVDVFVEFDDRARVATWRLDARRVGGRWRLADEQQLTSTENLYRLSLNPAKQLEARDLTIEGEDFDLHLDSGSVFLSEIDQGVAALILFGNGRMRFRPQPGTERGQVRIFCGSETLDARFDAAFLRINPAEFDARVNAGHLTARAVDPREFRRADEFFREQLPNSFSLDLGDLSPDAWSLLPPFGDLLAEVRTKRFGTLTYARSGAEPEDITLFDRRHRHNIALYASRDTLARRGPFYNEDDRTDYEVTDYDIGLTVSPERLWLEGQATLRIKVRAAALSSLSIKLANSLAVQWIAATGFGRLCPIRVRDQNTIIVNLPTALPKNAETLVSIAYAGRLEPQTAEQEAAQGGQATRPFAEEAPQVPPEPSFLYSNRSLWYPQGATTGYATARIRLTVPAAYDCVASGDAAFGASVPAEVTADAAHANKVYSFTATQPVRYLAFVVSRMVQGDTVTVPVPPRAWPPSDGEPALWGVSYDRLTLSIAANPRLLAHSKQLLDRAADIARFYASILGDYPYPRVAVALVEHDLPGGHGPAYFAELDQPSPATPYVWRNDPASFENYPEFFLAHELAHQWWGQGVGWRNYHEQWLSEGFAQYFAALYAGHHRGRGVFSALMRRLRRYALDDDDQGPIYLGYRLGHIKNDSRVFRAIVYDKGAAVLHMLRRLIGDEAFFRGLQRFYRASRFRKVGTEDLRLAMECEAGRSLDRFFEQWVYGTNIPRLRFRYRIEPGAAGQDVVLQVEQLGDVFDVPVPVTLDYADAPRVDVVVPVTDRRADLRVPLSGRLRSVHVRDDDGMLAELVK